MEYQYFLNDLEIDEPNGWADLELSLMRDETYHGVGREASTSALIFYSEAFEYLKTLYDTYGIQAEATFTANQRCEGGTEWEQVYTGRLNFGRYKKTCGLICGISLPIEQESCELVLRSRFDQKIDVDKQFGSDNISGLTPYSGLGMELYLPPKALQGRVEGYVESTGDSYTVDSTSNSNVIKLFRPSYADERYNNISTGQLVPAVYFEAFAESIYGPISPVLLFENNTGCFDTPLTIEARMKGTFSMNVGYSSLELRIVVVRWDGVGTLFGDAVFVGTPVTLRAASAYTADVVVSFDGTYNDTVTLAEGEGLYVLFEVTGDNDDNHELSVSFDSDTMVSLVGDQLCTGSNANVYMVHELLSRVAESITNNCITAKSSYYGRTDSEPYSFDSDGCGGVRCLTSGLKIRRAKEPKFFLSLKDLIEGLNGIDCIGFDVIEDPDHDGKMILRVESAEFFYQDELILAVDDAPETITEAQESKSYSQVFAGYKNWETDEANGLAELHSTREYRTALDTVNTKLDITSNLVAGAFVLEVTRIAQYGDTGGADTDYDNEAFILCLLRNAYGFEVETDNIATPENIFSPETQYNYRITPARNAMRWYKMVANVYPSLGDTTNKLFFSAGTGNLTARGELWGLAYESCKIESVPISENQDLFITHFGTEEDYTPLFKNELVRFEYPLNVAEYNRLKANPYGYITYNCGSEILKGFIKEVKWKPKEGKATFVLRAKW
jgi:hypothetical protein